MNGSPEVTTIQRLPYEDTEHYDEKHWTDGIAVKVAFLAILLGIVLNLV